LSGRLADSHFAAQLDQVVRNPDAYPIYGDPAEFFALTFPTAGLKRLLARTFGRLSRTNVEGTEHGVIRAETSFGGGKTHSLMAVYHLAKGARPANLTDFLDPAVLPERCRVAAVVADTLDPENGLVTDGIRSYTMWGEIAAQLGPLPNRIEQHRNDVAEQRSADPWQSFITACCMFDPEASGAALCSWPHP
jgi:predicted AAA+ superfamily ATPase